MESFENIHFDLSKQSGKCRVADNGLGWKSTAGGEPFTLDKGLIVQAQWSRAARGYEVRIFTRNGEIFQLDGFQQDDYERISRVIKSGWSVTLEQKEHALRGWNWGKGEFGKYELSFNVQNRPAFEIPYTEISNTNLAGRNEVAVDFSTAADEDDGATNGATNGEKKKKKGRKAAGARDQLVEARFYIPGTVLKKEKKENGENGEDGDADDDENEGDQEGDEEQHAASIWHETLVDKAEIGDVAGDTLASFLDLLHLTPRGRFDLDMYEKSMRLRGKTYDYKIQYDTIKKIFLLPKPDDVHVLLTLGLEPPLRQGQTRYPFIVMQFPKDDDIELEMNINEEDLNEKYKEKLKNHYQGPTHIVLTQLFRGIASKRIQSPSQDFMGRHDQQGIKCSIKANDGILYFMDKCLLFVPKPATYIALDQVKGVTMSRVGGAVSATRTFDITISAANGIEHQFSNINREEQKNIEDFFTKKGLKVRNEMAEDSKLISAALRDVSDSESDEVVQADRGSADEDSEEEDEDFRADSDSDVAEEYDSNAESSKSGSDDEMKDGDDESEEDTEAKVERPKKKTKTEK